MSNIEKTATTILIGSLARFEKNFGHIWGLGKPEDTLDENELRWREVWLDCRTEILNYGHSQVRFLKNKEKGNPQ